MTENKRYVQFEFPYDDFAVKDNKTNEELWNPKVVDRLNEQEELIKRLKEELFEARKDYIVDTADISDKPYLDEMIEEERKKIYGDVE